MTMKTILFCFIFCIFLINGEALDITASGGWSETIDSSDLTAGAGSNLNSIYESTGNASTIGISGCVDNNDNWRVDVRRVDGTWHNNFVFSVKRTTDGSGGGSVSGGLSYITVGTTDSEFFSGTGDRSGMNLQYRLSGVSITVSPDNYSTQIILTVIDN